MEVFYIKQELPINEQIRAREVQVIDEQGEKRGVMKLDDALDLAYEKKLDLVLVAPNVEEIANVIPITEYTITRKRPDVLKFQNMEAIDRTIMPAP